MEHYKTEELPLLLKYSQSLSEKAYRHFLAIQYVRLGRGSQRYIAKIFKCGRKTITKGFKELTQDTIFDYSRQRKQGGGRKKKI